MKEVSSRDKVLNVFEHRELPYIPVDFGGHRSSGIMAIAYGKLKKELGITSGDIYVYDVVQQLALVEDSVLEAFNIDTIELGRAFLSDDKEWKEWTLPDGTPCKIPGYVNIEQRGNDWFLYADNGKEVAVMKRGCLYFEQTYYPLRERGIEDDDFSDLEEVMTQNMWSAIPTPGSHISLSEAGLKKLSAGAETLRKLTNRCIIGLFGGNLFELPQRLYGTDNLLLYMAIYPKQFHRFLDKLVSIYIQKLEKWLQAVGKYIDIIIFGDDFGSQKGPIISPDMYREFFKERERMMWSRVKESADIKINLHSCGGIEPLLSDFIDAGLEAVNPVQISREGMDAETLKTKYGKHLTFRGGGCDTRSVLPNSEPEHIKQHVKSQVKKLSKNGGFVFQQAHNIQANVPPQNIIAMFEAVKEINSSVNHY